ncbi:ribonuclease H-like domain-containing protein [Tanacetum coccineum]
MVGRTSFQTNMDLMAFLDSEPATYKRGLATVEEQLFTYKKNEVLFSEEVADDSKANSDESEKGIKREYSVAKTPQQNGVAERRNRILIEAAKTMLADSKSPTTFWADEQ